MEMENSVWKNSEKRTDEIKSNFNITNINKIISYGYKQKVNISMYHDAKKNYIPDNNWNLKIGGGRESVKMLIVPFCKAHSPIVH